MTPAVAAAAAGLAAATVRKKKCKHANNRFLSCLHHSDHLPAAAIDAIPLAAPEAADEAACAAIAP